MKVVIYDIKFRIISLSFLLSLINFSSYFYLVFNDMTNLCLTFFTFQRYSKTMKRQIYFCGSICGGRGDLELYRRIIEQLEEYGEVLTKHIAYCQSESCMYTAWQERLLMAQWVVGLAARVLVYVPSHRQDSTYHNLFLHQSRNNSMGPPWRIDTMTHCTMSERYYHKAHWFIDWLLNVKHLVICRGNIMFSISNKGSLRLCICICSKAHKTAFEKRYQLRATSWNERKANHRIGSLMWFVPMVITTILSVDIDPINFYITADCHLKFQEQCI